MGAAGLAFVSSVGASTYVGNWLLASGVDLGPLSHAWSLAIEEQFYLLWPLAVLGVLPRLGRKRLALVLIVLVLAVTVGRTVGIVSGVPIQIAGWRTEFQADGLLVGCVVALLRVSVPPIAVGAGVVGLLAAALSPMTAATWTVAIVSAAAVVAGSGGGSDRLVTPVLTSRPAIYLGRISYGLYLWHYPLLWHLDIMEGPRQPLLAVAALVAAGLLADASYRWVEQRFLRSRRSLARPTCSGQPIT
jgi:peptidoglycan/LPS O-acetylase OafA/YrhL